jgi:hypothetical protein
MQEKSPLRLPEEHPADERGDGDTPGEPGDAVGQEVSDPDRAPRPDGGADRSTW